MSISRVAVVGAGLLGLAAAREATERFPDAEVTVFDKADTIAAHQSGHTSGIVDSGLLQTPGSDAADLARRGVWLLVPYLAERGVPYRECGQLILAQSTDEAERLEGLYARAQDNEVPGARLLERHELGAVEPAARGVLGLFAPHAAVADFAALAEALASDVRSAGGTIRLSTEVRDFDVMSNEVRLRGRAVPTAEHDDRGGADNADATGATGAAGDGVAGDGGEEAGASSDSGASGAADGGSGAGTSNDSGAVGDSGTSRDTDIDDQVHERPRTYRGTDGREPVIGLGDELRDRFGQQDWFKQAESTISDWTDRLSSSWSRSSERGSDHSSDRARHEDANRRADPVASGGRGSAHERTADATAEEVLGTFDLVLVCAGLQADRLATAAGLDEQPRIVPFTSDFYTARTDGTAEVRGIIGSVPDSNAPFAETTIIRGLGDSLVLGPNTAIGLGREAYDRRGFDLSDIGSTARTKGFWKFAAQTAKTAAKGMKTVVSKSAFVDSVRRFVPELDAESVRTGPRGIRAQAMTEDGQLIDELRTTRRGRLTVVRTVPKWGATSALAIAEAIVDRAIDGEKRPRPGGPEN